tara:strand:+ start:13 stop:945 length:933 start_codon:yes stop_codon:yes gene_type:complete
MAVNPNPNVAPPIQPQGLGVPVPPPQGGGMPQGGMPQGRVPVQPQGRMPMQPPRGRSVMDPRSRLEGIQDYAKLADQNPQRLAQALKGGASSGEQPKGGIGNLASNVQLIPEGSAPRDLKLHKVLAPLMTAAASALAMNLDPETRQELIESREPPVQEIIEETEDIPIDNSGIGNLANQFLGNNLPQLDSKSYAGMGENEIRAAAGGGLMGLAVEDEFSGMVEGEGHGMEDNVRMPIKEEGENIGVLAVSPKEYVVDSHTMSALGNGNPDEGADIMDEFVENIREEAFGTREQPNEIDGLASLQSMLERV